MSGSPGVFTIQLALRKRVANADASAGNTCCWVPLMAIQATEPESGVYPRGPKDPPTPRTPEPPTPDDPGPPDESIPDGPDPSPLEA